MWEDKIKHGGCTIDLEKCYFFSGSNWAVLCIRNASYFIRIHILAPSENQ